MVIYRIIFCGGQMLNTKGAATQFIWPR